MTTEAPEIQEFDNQVHDAVPMSTSGPTQAAIKFDVSAAAVAEMEAKAKTLIIVGPDDKAGYKAVYDYRQVVARQRVAVKKKQDALKRPHIDYNREVDTVAKTLIDPMVKIEDSLAKQEKAYNDERERIAEEKARAARIRYATRTKELQTWGFAFNPELDTYEFGALIINVDDIRDLSDEEYQPTQLAAKELYELEQDRLKQIELANQKEAERIAAEQEAERVRLQGIADQQADAQRKLDEQAAELKRKEEELAANLKKLQDEKDKSLLEARIERLLVAGFIQEGNRYTHLGIVGIREGIILSFDDTTFDTVIIEADARNKKQAEIEAKQVLLDKRIAQLLEAGFQFIYASGPYMLGEVTVHQMDITGYLDDEFNAIIIDAIQRDQQATLAKQKADKARTARLKPDIEALKNHLSNVSTTGPKMSLKQPETSDIYVRFLEKIVHLVGETLQEVEAL